MDAGTLRVEGEIIAPGVVLDAVLFFLVETSVGRATERSNASAPSIAWSLAACSRSTLTPTLLLAPESGRFLAAVFTPVRSRLKPPQPLRPRTNTANKLESTTAFSFIPIA